MCWGLQNITRFEPSQMCHPYSSSLLSTWLWILSSRWELVNLFRMFKVRKNFSHLTKFIISIFSFQESFTQQMTIHETLPIFTRFIYYQLSNTHLPLKFGMKNMRFTRNKRTFHYGIFRVGAESFIFKISAECSHH